MRANLRGTGTARDNGATASVCVCGWGLAVAVFDGIALCRAGNSVLLHSVGRDEGDCALSGDGGSERRSKSEIGELHGCGFEVEGLRWIRMSVWSVVRIDDEEDEEMVGQNLGQYPLFICSQSELWTWLGGLLFIQEEPSVESSG